MIPAGQKLHHYAPFSASAAHAPAFHRGEGMAPGRETPCAAREKNKSQTRGLLGESSLESRHARKGRHHPGMHPHVQAYRITQHFVHWSRAHCPTEFHDPPGISILEHAPPIGFRAGIRSMECSGVQYILLSVKMVDPASSVKSARFLARKCQQPGS